MTEGLSMWFPVASMFSVSWVNVGEEEGVIGIDRQNPRRLRVLHVFTVETQDAYVD